MGRICRIRMNKQEVNDTALQCFKLFVSLYKWEREIRNSNFPFCLQVPVTFCYIITCEVILRSAVTLLWHSTTNQKSKQLSARSLFCKERKSCPHLNSCKSANQLNFHRTIALICLEEKNKMEKVSKIDMFSMRSLDETNYTWQRTMEDRII